MKKQSLEILYRYRKHLVEREQATIADRLAEENIQKVRVMELKQRVAQTHEAKLRAKSSADLVALDQAAAYLHGRVTLAQRALAVARATREDAVARTLQLKKERDQVSMLLEKTRREQMHAEDEAERRELNEIAMARQVMAAGGL